MIRWIQLIIPVLCGLLILSCSSDANTFTSPDPLDNQLQVIKGGNMHLWGYYDVSIDPDTGTIEALPNRASMFTANVVNFINSNPLNLGFEIHGTVPGSGYIDVDLDVSITHPFPGLPQYHGYDVRGIFMGNGSDNFDYYFDLTYPKNPSDQMMMADPSNPGNNGGPDGYTRWFNISEFSEGGMPLFNYTPGALASPGFDGTATLCPYKYFADGLGVNDNVDDWIFDHPLDNGQFSSGATNTRNYYLRFPMPDPGVTFGYAVIANWDGPDEENHPSNAPEAVACEIVNYSNVYYTDGSNNGGEFDLDVSLYGWGESPSTIYIETPHLDSFGFYEFFPADMIPIGGSDVHSTWHVEFDVDTVDSADDTDFWVIAQYDHITYQNDFGQPNLAGEDFLCAFFRYTLDVTEEPGNLDPVCDLIVVTDEFDGWDEVPIEFDVSGSYDPEGENLTYEWDFDGDGIYDEDPDDSIDAGDEINPTHIYTEDWSGTVSVRLTDESMGVSICTTDTLEITILGCPDTSVPSVAPTSGYIQYANNGRAGIIRTFGDSGEEYFFGHFRDYYGLRYGWFAVDETGSMIQDRWTSVLPNYPPTLQGMACGTDNRVYVITYEQYNYEDSVLYYVDFDVTSPYSATLLEAPMPDISPWYFVKICVDENDYPVALVGNGQDLAIKHWNGTSWTHIDIADDATMYSENGYWNNGIEDIAYHPSSDTYWITNRYSGYTPNYDGIPTLYVINPDGTTEWSDDEIYPSVPLYTQFSVGIDIDVLDPDCRTLVLISCGATGTNNFDARFIRYDPFGNVTGSGNMPSGPPRYEFANGTVINSGSNAYYGAPVDFSGSRMGITNVPDW